MKTQKDTTTQIYRNHIRTYSRDTVQEILRLKNMNKEVEAEVNKAVINSKSEQELLKRLQKIQSE